MHRHLIQLMTYLFCLSTVAVSAQDRLQTVTLTTAAESEAATRLTGRVLAELQDGGILLEERSGQLHNLTAKQFTSVATRFDTFSSLEPDDLAAKLL